MSDGTSRTQEQVFKDMFRELRAWNPEISESPERMDPILRILLQLYSSQLTRIDRRIDRVWEIATQSLIRSVCPETRRWPVPAFTVMKCDLSDPVVEIDTTTRFFYKEEREGGGTYFFTPLRAEKLVSATVVQLLAVRDGRAVPVPTSYRKGQGSTAVDSAGSFDRLYAAIGYEGPATDLAGATIVLRGAPEALRVLQWSRWRPSQADGSFVGERGFCPGLQDTLNRMFSNGDDQPRLWGGFRTSADMFRPLENNVVLIPETFAEVWKEVPAGTLLSGAVEPPPMDVDVPGKRFWIELLLPERSHRPALLDGVGFDFGSFIATNRNEMTLFRHTGGNRVIDIELPEPIDSILEITHITDSAGNEYRPRYEMTGDSVDHSYTLQDQNDRLVLWFDFSSQLTLPPESVTVTYSVTDGTDANGIDPNRITELYESHPGIRGCRNLTASRGAIPAKTAEQVLTEVATRLRSRDRALTFADIVSWARTFDPRIRRASCENGIQRTHRGVRRCIVINLEVAEADFLSRDEIELLRRRLSGFLKARSPINTHYQTEIIRV